MLALLSATAAAGTTSASATSRSDSTKPGPGTAARASQVNGAHKAHGLVDIDEDLEHLLNTGSLPAAKVPAVSIKLETTMVTMRDGVRLATDLYLPPELPAPVVAMRTPYGRDRDANVSTFMSYARRGYVVVAQDCRGTGGSEPDSWDYYMYESEDGYDFV